ncbi:glycerophosphoryl diester phosphodiesterase [Fluviicoccus keumensis]|uniref:Glycerophosphoryl diester phosphodiesterase n=1 Tax=Fluviicoccus keumensis TaxID=1435465 RepID=A0A4Q7Z9A4_9GAMM|nr:glycerophosphodiester phosphodiesterase [Fluviicoccus keumensis]RZU47090.1 glycerophosphoryl diester phosphodiesterase [Fluviicoccus keumensis]
MEIAGHRGARGEAPENTLSGFRHLYQSGFRAVEFDIQVAGDGALVVIHDNSVDRTTSGSGPLSAFTAPQLARLDACHHRQFPDASGHPADWPESDGVPQLQEVLAVLADFTHLQLEVKAAAEADVATVVRLLPEMAKPFGRRAVTTSFNVSYLERIRDAAPSLPRGLLVEKDYSDDVTAAALALGCVSIGPHFSLCTPELIRRAHAAGLRVSTWTVNDPETMLKLRDMGVDSIITDYPQLARRVLA